MRVSMTILRVFSTRVSANHRNTYIWVLYTEGRSDDVVAGRLPHSAWHDMQLSGDRRGSEIGPARCVDLVAPKQSGSRNVEWPGGDGVGGGGKQKTDRGQSW